MSLGPTMTIWSYTLKALTFALQCHFTGINGQINRTYGDSSVDAA